MRRLYPTIRIGAVNINGRASVTIISCAPRSGTWQEIECEMSEQALVHLARNIRDALRELKASRDRQNTHNLQDFTP